MSKEKAIKSKSDKTAPTRTPKEKKAAKKEKARLKKSEDL